MDQVICAVLLVYAIQRGIKLCVASVSCQLLAQRALDKSFGIRVQTYACGQRSRVHPARMRALQVQVSIGPSQRLTPSAS
jgi:hypothetical protein